MLTNSGPLITNLPTHLSQVLWGKLLIRFCSIDRCAVIHKHSVHDQKVDSRELQKKRALSRKATFWLKTPSSGESSRLLELESQWATSMVFSAKKHQGRRSGHVDFLVTI